MGGLPQSTFLAPVVTNAVDGFGFRFTRARRNTLRVDLLVLVGLLAFLFLTTWLVLSFLQVLGAVPGIVSF